MELQAILLRGCKETEAEIGILDHIAAIAAPDDIGIVTLAAGQVIVPGPAIECVVVDEAVDRIIVLGARVGEHLFDDLGEFERIPAFEQELLDQVWSDIFQPVRAAEQCAEQPEIKPDAAKLADNLDRLTGLVAIVVEDDDQQIFARPVAQQAEVVSANATAENEKIETRLNWAERERSQIVNHIMPVTRLDDIQIAAGTA